MAKRKGEPPRIYLCSTEWVGLLAAEPGSKHTAELIERAQGGAFDIVGSELLRVEVLSEHGPELLERSVRTWAAMDRTVAQVVRDFRIELRRTGSLPKHSTPDLIHIATATVAGAEAFVTTDGECRDLATSLGLHAYDRLEYPDGEMSFGD